MPEFDLLRATVLALVQGFTEFLPISSSGHLLLPTLLLGWEDQGLAFDVAVHLGTLLAVVVYFFKDLLGISSGMVRQVTGRGPSPEARLGWYLVVATLPVLLAGLLLKDLVDAHLRDARVVAATTIAFGLLLWVADWYHTRGAGRDDLDWRKALCIGLAQTLALIPGTSRSGITMTAGLFCGLDREAASRFSFLLSIPVIAGAALLLLLDLLDGPAVNWAELGFAMALAAVTAWTCIHFFLHFIARIGFLPFVVYRLLLGIFLLLVL